MTFDLATGTSTYERSHRDDWRVTCADTGVESMTGARVKRVEPYLADADLVLVKGLGQTPSIVANCASHPHDPAEIDRLDPFTDRIPYDWARRHG